MESLINNGARPSISTIGSGLLNAFHIEVGYTQPLAGMRHVKSPKEFFVVDTLAVQCSLTILEERYRELKEIGENDLNPGGRK